MADTRYAKGKQKQLQGEIDFINDDIKFVLVDLDLYDPDVTITGDEFLADIPSGAQAAISPNMTGKTSVGGVADCDDFVWTAVPVGPPLGAAVMYKDTGSAATSPLILYQDSGGPVVPINDDIGYQINTSGLYAE